MRKREILRRNGKLVGQVIMYDSPTARLGVVVPKGRITKIPDSATQVAVRFVDKKSLVASIGRPPKGAKGSRDNYRQLPITLKADTVRKHMEIF